MPLTSKGVKPELNQFTELLKQKSSETKKSGAPLQRMLSQPIMSNQEESMLISEKKSIKEP